jgi:DNA-directed RNA polymerase II subunit RPB1
MACVG